MIKRTLYFGNPAYLSLKQNQLVIHLPEVVKSDLSEGFKEKATATIPIEDIGVVILDNQQITITHGLLEALLDNNAAVITCNSKRMPQGLLLPLEKNTTQSERFQAQIEASLPLKKQLWQQTIIAKIENQGSLLQSQNKEVKNMRKWAKDVKSGDSSNLEARAAAYYWKNIFTEFENFSRDRYGEYPNNLLNYGYAILRAVVARSLVASGLLPTFGIFHRNKYNAYCLADDIMEPYRPFVDKLILQIWNEERKKGNNLDDLAFGLTKEIKTKLLQIPVLDVNINGERNPLMIAVAQTSSSLAKCYLGESRKISYPYF